jgi:hypothetical protein
MRYTIGLLVALALGSSAALAQSSDWANKLFLADNGTTTHDFGSVPRGALLYHRFPMRNIYAVPLEIVNVRASCGCVTATPSAQVFQPQQEGYLEVMMDAHRFTGPKSVTVFLTVGPQYTSTASLRISANSRADVVFNPGQVNFGVVQRGQSPTQIVEVEYAGALDWRVSEVARNGAPLDVVLEEWYRRPGQVGYRVRATLKADAPAGPLKHEIHLKTNDPASPLVPLLIEAVVQAPLTVVPNTLALGDVKIGEQVTRRFVVRGTQPFKVVAVEGAGEDVQVDLPASAAPVQVVTLKFQPAKAGDVHRQLRIKTDLDKESSATLTVEAKAAP